MLQGPEYLQMLDKILQFSQRGVMMHPTLLEHVTLKDYKWHKISDEAEFTFNIDNDTHTEFIPGWDLDNYISGFKDIPKAGQKPNNPMLAEVNLMKKKLTTPTVIVKENVSEKQEMTLVKKDNENTPKLINHEDSDDVVVDIKAILFDTINKVQKKQMDIKTAQGIGSLCQVVINAIKVEQKL